MDSEDNKNIPNPTAATANEPINPQFPLPKGKLIELDPENELKFTESSNKRKSCIKFTCL